MKPASFGLSGLCPPKPSYGEAKADVVELAYTLVSEAKGRKPMRVQLPPSALLYFQDMTYPSDNFSLRSKL